MVTAGCGDSTVCISVCFWLHVCFLCYGPKAEWHIAFNNNSHVISSSCSSIHTRPTLAGSNGEKGFQQFTPFHLGLSADVPLGLTSIDIVTFANMGLCLFRSCFLYSTTRLPLRRFKKKIVIIILRPMASLHRKQMHNKNHCSISEDHQICSTTNSNSNCELHWITSSEINSLTKQNKSKLFAGSPSWGFAKCLQTENIPIHCYYILLVTVTYMSHRMIPLLALFCQYFTAISLFQFLFIYFTIFFLIWFQRGLKRPSQRRPYRKALPPS